MRLNLAITGERFRIGFITFETRSSKLFLSTPSLLVFSISFRTPLALAENTENMKN